MLHILKHLKVTVNPSDYSAFRGDLIFSTHDSLQLSFNLQPPTSLKKENLLQRIGVSNENKIDPA